IELNAFVAYQREREAISDSAPARQLFNWCREAGLNARGLEHALLLRDRIGAVCRRLGLPWVEAEPAGNPEPVLRALTRGFFGQVSIFSSGLRG
ncbi:unnamed protein product, partial [Protopolystoma xenopodis]